MYMEKIIIPAFIEKNYELQLSRKNICKNPYKNKKKKEETIKDEIISAIAFIGFVALYISLIHVADAFFTALRTLWM